MDQFEKKRNEKRERVDKNEFQRLRNIARNQKGKMKGAYMYVCVGVRAGSQMTVTIMYTCSIAIIPPLSTTAPLPPPHTKDMGKHEVGDTAALCEKESTLLQKEVVGIVGIWGFCFFPVNC